jgi:simple sugar transport system substrate-binding protein
MNTSTAPRWRPGRRSIATASIALASALVLTACSAPAESEETAPAEPLSVAFIGESSATDAIWSLAVSEMREEAEELGVDFVDRFAEGDFALQARLIDEEVARGVDAIIAPFFDPQAANAAIGRALEAGVKVYALLGVPDLPADQLAQLGVTEASWEEYGRVLAEVTLPQVSDGASILWPAEVPGATYITDAVIGFEAYMAEKGFGVEVTVLDAGSDATTSAARQLSYLTANPETDAIVTTGSIAIGAATTAMRQGALAAGSPPLVGFVTNPQGYQGVVDGFIKTGIWPGLDDIARQALRDVVDMVNDGIEAPKRVQPYVLVDASNVDEIIPESIRQ